MVMVRMDRKKVRGENNRPPRVIMSPSRMKMVNPTLTDNLSAMYLASRSVPPVLILFRSMMPNPTPIKIPPMKELVMGWICNGARRLWLMPEKRSMKKEEIIMPGKLLKKKWRYLNQASTRIGKLHRIKVMPMFAFHM